MLTEKHPINRNCNQKKKQSAKAASSCALGAMAAVSTITLAPASMRAEEAPPPSRVNALFNLEFSNEYVTPRGMIVHDKGLTFQPLLLGFINLYKADSFINDVTLVPGVWNDFSTSPVSVHAPFGSQPKTSWVEIDPIMGISFGFAKHFKLDVTYTAFNMQILDIGTSQHLETKLSFDDSAYLKGFALHPYFEMWQEVDGKATAADVPELVLGPSDASGSHPKPGSSYYLELGIAPGYVFEDLAGLKLEAPCRVLFPNERFYGEYYDDASVVGLYEVGGKASIPLKFMPQGYGLWSVHLGVRYLHFVDENLFQMNSFNAPGKPTRDTVQVYGGFSIFF